MPDSRKASSTTWFMLSHHSRISRWNSRDQPQSVCVPDGGSKKHYGCHSVFVFSCLLFVLFVYFVVSKLDRKQRRNTTHQSMSNVKGNVECQPRAWHYSVSCFGPLFCPNTLYSIVVSSSHPMFGIWCPIIDLRNRLHCHSLLWTARESSGRSGQHV